MYVKHYNKKKVKWKCQEFFFFLEIKKCIWKNFYFKTENSKITPTINIKIVEKEKNVKMEQYLRKMKTKQKIKQKEEGKKTLMETHLVTKTLCHIQVEECKNTY